MSQLSDENARLKNQLKTNKVNIESRAKKGSPKNALKMTTSMATHIKSETFNDRYTGVNVIFKCHHGGRVKKVREALEYRLSLKEKPDVIVFQAGGTIFGILRCLQWH